MSKRTQEEQIALITQWRASGKSLSKWCREKNISKSTFAYWRDKYDSFPSENRLQPKHFTELQNSTAPSVIEIRSQGLCISFPLNCNPSLLIFCIKALKGKRC